MNNFANLTHTANSNFPVDLHANSAGDPQGFGEGARHIGSGMVTIEGAGSGTFDLAEVGF